MAKSKDVKETLMAYLKELHLPAFRTSFEEAATLARQEGLSYEEFLLSIVDPENWTAE